MSDADADPHATDSLESALRLAVARGDAVRGSVAPVLRHLLAGDDLALFAEAIVARVRGIIVDLAAQMCAELASAHGLAEPLPADDPALARLARALADVPDLIAHVHALALEGQLAEQLHLATGLDPVLSPLLQALIASSDGPTAAAAMKLLTAQARFVRQLRQMRLPLDELPADLLHAVLAALHGCLAEHLGDGAQAGPAADRIRARYDESATRLGLCARLATGMGGGMIAALNLPHSGLAIFATALGLAGGEGRDAAMLTIQPGQFARLALALRAAGLKVAAMAETMLALDPAAAMPDGLARIEPARAAMILGMAADHRG